MKISKSFKIYIHTILALFFLINISASSALPNNLIIHENPKIIKNVKFKDFNFQEVDLSKNKGNIVILNFWATWCAPCKKEMPSLNKLAVKFPNLRIFPINMENPDKSKSKAFFDELNLNNLDVFFDPEFNLAKKFRLRGLPTTILINKDGREFARVVGEIDFEDIKFINFLKDVNF
tara:strand:+ start:10 stop:540 length:531 start_codon:yes stop_codon:yes gene_type:complete